MQRENDQLWAQIEKSRDLGKDVRDSSRAAHPTARNKGKELIVPDNVDTPTDNELSSGSSPSLSLSPTKDARGSTKTKSLKRSSHHPAFSDAVSGASRRARIEVGRKPNPLVQALRNASVLPAGTMPPMQVVHPAFGSGLTFYMPPASLIRRPDDMLSLTL